MVDTTAAMFGRDVEPPRQKDIHAPFTYLGLHDRFQAMVALSPDSVALVCDGLALTYDALNRRANQLAHRLLAEGLQPGQLVGLHVERGLFTVVGILGILKAGGAYLPLDPVYPADRIAFMLEDSGVSLLVTEPVLSDGLKANGITRIFPDSLVQAPQGNPGFQARPEDLAYVIYTSGSTGRPKGVMVQHRNVTRLFDATEAWFHFGAQDVWTLFHSYSFDFSVWEIWGALLYGGKVVVVPQRVSRSPEEFRALLISERVTVLSQTPSAFRQLIQADLAEAPADYALRTVIFGGEALDYQGLRPWFSRYGDARPQLVNMYGITETTVHVTYRPVTLSDLESGRGSLIGAPIPDLQLHVLDDNQMPVPAGTIGEMYVGGAGVALGYLNRPELTTQRFLADPFSDKPDARLYRTGDLARRLDDGELEYLGRIDHQVKLRGFRIELGEIESAISANPSVRANVVILREDTPGDKRLVGYVVAPGAGPELIATIRADLQAVLPEYMVPSAFVMLPALQLTENGKVDRRTLPEPVIQRSDAEYQAPRNAKEIVFAQVWAEVLGLDRVGVTDDFFELGGHSLLVMETIQRLRTAGLHVKAGQFFVHRTLSAVAEAATESREQVEVLASRIPVGAIKITPDMLPLVALRPEEISSIVAAIPGGAGKIQDIYPLSPMQEGMLFHHRMAGAGDPYIVSIQVSADSRDKLFAYAEALRELIARHDILRSAFVWRDIGQPVQVVCREAPLVVEELDLNPSDGDIAQQLRDRFDPRKMQLDPGHAPLIRLYVAQDAPNDRWVMLRLHHHLLEDHTADELMNQEIITILEGNAAHLTAPLPYRDFVVHARSVAQSEECRAHFTEMLADVDEPTAPFGLTDTLAHSTRINVAQQHLDAPLSSRLRRVARRHRFSVASIFHLAWGKVIAQTSGRDDVVFGTVLFGRMQGGENAQNVVGPFINSLPLRLKLEGASVAEALQQTHHRLAGLLQHEHASLAMAQGCSGVAGSVPLFTALINYRHSRIIGEGTGSADHAIAEAFRRMDLELLKYEERTNYPIQLSVDDIGDGFILEAQAQDPVAPERLCGYMLTVLDQIATALERAPETAIETLTILPELERTHLIKDMNDTTRDFAGPGRLHQWIELQVARTPDAPALDFEGRSLTYAEVNARANRLARVLREKGVGPNVLVGVFAERSFEMVLSLLAILKAGGAYVPLDPSYPAERLGHVIEDAKASVVLSQPHLKDRLPESPAEVIEVDATWTAFADRAPHDLEDTGASGDLAYVIFTSGSTGRPKGAMNEHGAIINRLAWMQEEYGLTTADRVLQKTPFSFDVSVWEFFWPLMVGARLVIARPEGHRDPAYLVDLICRTGITTTHFVPSMLRIFLDSDGVEGCASLRLVMCSGEALPHEVQERFFDRLPQAGLHNLYGPTEAAVDVSYWACQRGDARRTVPIGRPVANTQLYILDRRMQLLPEGVAGELFIGGVQVGRGYVGRDDLTEARFVPDPYSGRPGARLYRTGDLARFLPDGAIEYLGRTDFQVKIRGQRIELGEIEAVLDQHPQVSQSLVMARGEGADLWLAAYIVPRNGLPTAESLRARLAAQLPSYMVPSAFVVLEALPLTSNGKVDRRALPEPDRVQRQTAVMAPRTPIESEIARIWSEVLSLEAVGVHDNFFELGGHSLLAVSVIERMRRAGLNAEMRALFVSPTIAELAGAVTDESTVVDVPPNLIPPGCSKITPEMLPLVKLNEAQIDRIVAQVPGGAENVQDIYPLAPLQEGFLFHHRLMTEGDLYIMSTQFAFRLREDLDRYLGALQWVISRNDIMRTMFVWEDLDEPVQVVCRSARLPVEEVVLDPVDGDVAQQLRDRYNLLTCRFDMQQPPMIRVYVAYDAANGRWIFHQLTHHMMDDQTTVNLQEDELQAYLTGRADEITAPSQFRGYVAQSRHGVSAADHEAFFKELLGDVDEPTMPFGFSDLFGSGAGIAEAREFLEPGLSQRLLSASQRLGVSSASVFHEAFALMLGRLSGRDDVVFGTVLLGRMSGIAGSESVIGPCINTLPVRIRLEDIDVERSLRRTHGQLAQLLRHEHAPLRLVQRCSSVDPGVPLFNSIINYRRPTRGTGRGQVDPANGQLQASAHEETTTEWFSTDIPGREFLHFLERTNFPLTLSIDDFGNGFRLVAQVQEQVDPLRICRYMSTAIEELVNALELRTDLPTRSIRVLPDSERHQLVTAWNDNNVPFDQELLMHDLVSQQAGRTPHRVAVCFGDQRMTYAELEAKSNRLAQAIRARGVIRADRVGICLNRTIDLPVAVLGVQKAGGCYVPLDPDYPPDRLRFMAEDADLKLLLTETDLADLVVVSNERKLLVDRDAAVIAAQPALALPVEAEVSASTLDPAYMIYTSGSTGTPKGVAVPHRGAVNFLMAMVKEPGLTEDDIVLAITTLSFDISVLELFLPMVVGARVQIATRREAVDAHALAALLDRSGATVLQGTPPTWRMLLTAGWRAKGRFKALTGGEALQPDLAETLIGQGIELWNMYGPTETTVWCTCSRITDHREVITIGRPIQNMKMYVLDQHGRPCPAGVPGELCVGGVGVTSYWNRPELNALSYLPDPFSKVPGALYYRTGDNVRWTSDGRLEHLGRLDNQIKLRGFRIELGEIEAAIRRVRGIRDTVVILRNDRPGDPRLTAYVVPEKSGADLSTEVRAHLQNGLPLYMVPADFVTMAALPLTPSRKIDRRALPAPVDSAPLDTKTLPFTPTEQRLARIWRDVLGIGEVGVDDDFFELGGHSLLALDVIIRIERELDIRLPVRAMIEGRTIRQIALFLDGASVQHELPNGIVCVQKGTGARKLFCIPGLGGVALQYHNLAAKLHTDWSIYSLEVHDLNMDPSVMLSFQDIAKVAVENILIVQPKGPYSLLGYSFGGNLAFEVAAEMERRGMPTELVCAIDSYVPGAFVVKKPLEKLAQHVSNLASMSPGEAYEYLGGRIRRRLPWLDLGLSKETDLQRRLRAAEESGKEAMRRYRPSRFGGKVSLFRANVKDDWIDVQDDSGTGGWGRLCAGVDVTMIDCGHMEFFREPHLSSLAQHVDVMLRQRSPRK